MSIITTDYSPRASSIMMSQRPQFGPEKSSFYLPAVLRPTEPPKHMRREPEPLSPSTPPSLITGVSHGALCSIGSPESVTSALGTKIGLTGVPALDIESSGKVTGPPTRVHWKPDPLSTHCDSPSTLCTRAFTTFRRRHHCRRCGLIFCNIHSLYKVPLDQDANFHPFGTQSRACERCWLQWVKWVERRQSVAGVVDMDSKNYLGIEPATPPLNMSPNTADSHQSNNLSTITGINESEQSVPKDWSWSTF